MRTADLLAQRWLEAQHAFGLLPGDVTLTWEIGSHPHFKDRRGYAVTFACAQMHCHLRLSKKMLTAPMHRVDGVIRHEIGHVLDLTIHAAQMNHWAFSQGVALPETPERRADAIAHAIWGAPICYDHEMVQTTGYGTCPRPLQLGL